MNQYYEKEYSERRAHRYHARHRATKKLSLLLLLLGILCIVISLFMFGLSFVGSSATRHTRLVLSLCYVGAGIAMIGARWVVEYFRNRGAPKRGRSNYQPRLSSAIVPPPRQTLPLNGKTGADLELSGDKGGAALVLVLILLSLIVGLVVETQISARVALRSEQAGLLQTRLRQAASDAAWSALRRIADDEDLAVDHTNEIWAAKEEAVDPSGISTLVKVSDQNRYFDFNNLAVETPAANARPAADVAMDIMTLCGDFAPVDRIDALADWVDSNEDGFAEKARYREKTPPYEAANRPLYAMSELTWVDGFSRAYFARHERRTALEVFSADFVDCLTVLPGPHNSLTPVNVNTAGKEVLQGLLGIAEEGLVQLIKLERDAQPIRSIDALFARTGRPVPEELRPYLDVKSRYFLVESQAYAEGQSQRLQVLAHRGSEGNVDVLHWVF